MSSSAYDAVVLAGGRSRRMGGADKTRLPVGDVALLDRVLAAVTSASRIIVVGEPRPCVAQVTWTLEEPPGAGPPAAVAAGLELVSAPVVVLLAADLPFLTGDVVAALVGDVEDDGAVPVDQDGAEQWLCSAWRVDALRRIGWCDARSMRAALQPLRFRRVEHDTAGTSPWTDCDTPEELRRARGLT